MTEESRVKANSLVDEIKKLEHFIEQIEYFGGEKRAMKRIEKKGGIFSIFYKTPLMDRDGCIEIPSSIQSFLSQELCEKAKELIEKDRKEIEEL